MDAQIEKWRVQQYAANVAHYSQQKGSRLAGLVRKEVFKGKAEFFDKLGLATAQAKGPRGSDTPNLNIDHDRRMVTTLRYEWATLVDRKDKLQQIHSPENEYAVAARNALGRKMDEVILSSALGTAMAGEDGTTSVALPNSQRLAATTGAAHGTLNLLALRKAKLLFDKAEAVGKRYIVCDAASIESLLTDDKLTSADFNTVRALVNGEINQFMGFTFIHTELVPTTVAGGFAFDVATGLYAAAGAALNATSKSCVAFVGDGIILGMNEGAVGKIDERADKNYDTQVYASMDFGGVRMEEVKVVEIIVNAS